ncbi:MAG: peptidoglycan-binding protein [Candidatus Omnitrophica bacterium]|nr:peptidoglycan-binding protein [Candidatus Omnitrophota bacterium]
MKKSMGLLVLSALFLTGCATCTDRIGKLESRIDTLEGKSGITAEKEAVGGEEAAVGTEATELAAKEIVAPESPTKKDIQAALKNAGFYQGDVDGKFGPKSKKAVEDFQTANDLKADGKVGPNTWDKLKKYYVPTETLETQTK